VEDRRQQRQNKYVQMVQQPALMAVVLDFILFMNLVALSVVLLAFSSNFCNELPLFP
jgi:hypothetical protein